MPQSTRQNITMTTNTKDKASNDDSARICEEKRLWIGNLDVRINEYQLLKLLQKHGTIEKFDLLFHRSGPLMGQPRGYAFVTFATQEEAERAKSKLHNMLVGNRHINVTWAHTVNYDEPEKRKPALNIPALAGTQTENKKRSRETQIQAIEAKLKLMEGKKTDDIEINKTLSTETPVILQYQQKLLEGPPSNTSSKPRYNSKRHRPYHNNSRHKRR